MFGWPLSKLWGLKFSTNTNWSSEKHRICHYMAKIPSWVSAMLVPPHFEQSHLGNIWGVVIPPSVGNQWVSKSLLMNWWSSPNMSIQSNVWREACVRFTARTLTPRLTVAHLGNLWLISRCCHPSDWVTLPRLPNFMMVQTLLVPNYSW